VQQFALKVKDLAGLVGGRAATPNITVGFQLSRSASKLPYHLSALKAWWLVPTSSDDKQILPAKGEKTPILRARRLSMQTAVRYRAKGLGRWHQGQVENLSQSGIVLQGPQHLPDYTLVEMVFEMPGEISGQKNGAVLCQGRIVRHDAAPDGESVSLAASILDYKPLH
jgi:hypothetical protein